VTYVPPEINQNRQGAVLLVGRDPGEEEVILGRPFVGKAGRLLDEVLSEAGWRRSDVNVTNVVPYQPRDNLFQAHDPQVVAEGVLNLHGLIERLKPSLIITLGNEAAHALVEGWPSTRQKGMTIFGAKSIEARRGYFWKTRHGTVLTALHPAGVLRKELPGKWLLGKDFLRARLHLSGELKREEWPEVRRLNSAIKMYSLLHSKMVGWDIESKWGGSATLCCGFCGDDLRPLVALCQHEYQTWGVPILKAKVPKVGHHTLYDLTATKMRDGFYVTALDHDTQQMWHSLEPDLAGTDVTGGGETEIRAGAQHMTRKGLAFLASIEYDIPWWKDYPEEERDDPEAVAQMIQLNGVDAWVTRRLADLLLTRVKEQDVEWQYRRSMDLYPSLVRIQIDGLRVDDKLREARELALEERSKKGMELSKTAALPYIVEHDVPAFRKVRKCPCCGGGKVAAKHCWRCGGLPKKPERLSDYPEAEIVAPRGTSARLRPTLKSLRDALPECRECSGSGKIKTYFFNPLAPEQLKSLLYNTIGVPKSTWKGKVVMDDTALKKVLQWSLGG